VFKSKRLNLTNLSETVRFAGGKLRQTGVVAALFVTVVAPDGHHYDVRVPGNAPNTALSGALARLLDLRSEPGRDILVTHIDAVRREHALGPNDTLDACGVTNGATLRLDYVASTSSALMPPARPHTQPDLFQRAPRVRFGAAPDEIAIAAPGSKPNAPSLMWPALLMPALFAAASLMTSLLSRNTNGPMNALTTGFMAMSALNAVLTYWLQRRAYRRDSALREQRYHAYLDHIRDRLRVLAVRQRVDAVANDPDMRELLARIEHRSNVWMRMVSDQDFLRLRLGVGAGPINAVLKPPQHEPLLTPDPLGDLALALAAELHIVDALPVTLDLRAVGAFGLAGARRAVVDAAAALAMHVVAHHSPDDVAVAALFPQSEAARWRWLRWLPHVRAPQSDSSLLAQTPAAAARVLDRVCAAAQRRARLGMCATPTVLFLADPTLYERHPAFPAIVSDPASFGVTPVFLADARMRLPRECRAFVEIDGGVGRLFVDGDETPRVIESLDHAHDAQREPVARSLAAMRLKRSAAPIDVPVLVPLLDLWQTRTTESLGIAERWRSHAHLTERSLRVPIGRLAGGDPLELDLRDGDRGHGAHGLVAGMTGSGKSELLQTLIAALAVRFHPDWLSLLLIDYKGGGMANAFQADPARGARAIPHLAGAMTNLLDTGAAQRALTALNSELRRRQLVFERAGVTYIDDFQRLQASDPERFRADGYTPMPRLVIVVDEFAELKRDQPEFMKQLISAARIGRSLGVHLILATQKPSGVVDDQIWSNSRFKLCLRVQDDGDSREMLKRPDAAAITRAGHGYFMVGRDELFVAFQAGYGGAPYLPERAPDAAERYVAPFGDDGQIDDARRVYLDPPLDDERAPRQLDALVDAIRVAAESVGAAPAERIWLEPLPALLPPQDARLVELEAPSSNEFAAILGLLDDPRARAQRPLRYSLDRDGHLMIFGQPGSGKSTLLQRLVLDLAQRHGPESLHIYALDFGNRALTSLAALPHVGAVLVDDDDERIPRLLRTLRAELARRKALLGGRKPAEHRATTGAAALPALLVLIDNFPAFARFDDDDLAATIAREGAALGVHLVLTANKPMDVRSRVSGNITLALALQLAERADYAAVVGRTAGLEPAPFPGRGLIKAAPPLEFQAALPADGATDGERAIALADAIATVVERWSAHAPAPPVSTLPATLLLADLPAPDHAAWADAGHGPLPAPFALYATDLTPASIDLAVSTHIAITGLPQSGKTWLQCALAHALMRANRGRIALYACDASGGEGGLGRLVDDGLVAEILSDDAALQHMAQSVALQCQQWRTSFDQARSADPALSLTAHLCKQPRIVILIDELDALQRMLGRATREVLDALLERGARSLPVHVVVAGGDRALDAMDGWVRRVKDAGNWFVLGGLNSPSFPLRLPPADRDRPLPPGQGYWAQRRAPKPLRVKIASPWQNSQP
jgi:S-DNA-T family DNA segregation ATPase FtsK/SpoIIIE